MCEAILGAYREGWFPMADPRRGVIEWVQPEVRGLIPLDGGKAHFARSLRQRVRSGRFEMRVDSAVERVIRACAEPRPGRDETWIDETIVRAYSALHARGIVHSVEAWRGGELVGGLYGVAIGGAFFGESMFSRPESGGTDSSKVCLVHLVHHLRRGGYVLLDAQFWNPHLEQFGCEGVPRSQYLVRLRAALETEAHWGEFEPVRTVAELGNTGA
jgi:leucyl/phenylalanyl-tRNA--protein transferase